MKKIMFSEGEHDTSFLEKVFKKLGCDKSADYFDQKSVSIDEKYTAETVCLRRFFEENPFNPYEILVKSEGGQPSMIQAACRFTFRELFPMNINPILLTDLGDGKLEFFLVKLNKEFCKRQIPISVRTDSPFHWSPLITNATVPVMLNNNVGGNPEELGKFIIIAFNSDLETSAGINDSDDSQIIDDKLSKLAEQDTILSSVKAALVQ